jgi:uncharacterized membrane protein YkoI
MATIKETIGAGLAAAVLAALAGGWAVAGDDRDDPRSLKEAGSILSVESVAEHARLAQPGRIIEIGLEADREGYRYEVELVDDSGQVHELRLDARTGETLESETKFERKEVASDLLPAEMIATRALEWQPGRLREIELESGGERAFYKVKVVDESGRLRKLDLDARNGEPLLAKAKESGR